jgi:transmembrane sensor
MLSQHKSPIPSDVAERAVEWLVDLQAEHVAPALREEWQRWRSAHPDHERAWQRIEAVNGKLLPAASPISRALAHATLTPPDSSARRNVIATLAVLLFAGGATWVIDEGGSWSATQRTATGERRSVLLADGTAVTLNTASAINVDFNARERRVRLISGEIFIVTAKDGAGRPFLVETGHGTAEALGTRYAVRLRDGASEIAVFDGAVRITPGRAPARAVVLAAGEQASFGFTATGIVQKTSTDRTAWIDGFIVVKNMRLADFLVELARYSRHTLSCAPEVAELGVSGSYPLSDIDKVLASVATMLSLQTETVTRFWGAPAVRLSRAS